MSLSLPSHITRLYRCPPCLAHFRRNIWTCKTVSTTSIDILLEALPDETQTRSVDTTLFTLSRNIPAPTLSALFARINSLPGIAIGCLSHSAEDSKEPYTLAYASHTPEQGSLQLCVPFRSTLKGLPKIALGREVQRSKMDSNEPIDMEWAGDTSAAADPLPEALQGLHAKYVKQIIIFSDEQPQGLMKTLDTYFPKATKLGLIASSTPFVTGRPHTLVMGKEVHSTGAVGIAVCQTSVKATSAISLNFESLSPLGEALEVTDAKGNIITELAGSNATKLLLERIQTGMGDLIDKEQGFYLGILPEGKQHATLDELVSVRPIMAGDPKRGALSLDTEANVKIGQRVQFLRSQPDAESYEKQSLAISSLAFGVPSRGVKPNLIDNEAVHPHFHAISEHGVLIGHAERQSWLCNVENSTSTMQL